MRVSEGTLPLGVKPVIILYDATGRCVEGCQMDLQEPARKLRACELTVGDSGCPEAVPTPEQCVYICIYIYIERDVCLCTYMCIYITKT